MGRKYIHTFAGINGHNNDPSRTDYLALLEPEVKPVVPPDYKQFIQGVALRRLSKILKKSLACAQTVSREMGDAPMEGIIVATGLGCLDDTRKFLIDSHEHVSPSPTPFIHSTHNTIAGQLGLHMKCHGYNITHANVGGCVEGALTDVLLQQGSGWYLVGCIDEKIDWLDLLVEHSELHGLELGSGATFMAISEQPAEIELVDSVSWLTNGTPVRALVLEFLGNLGIELDEIEVILSNEDIDNLDQEMINFQDYCGAFLTNTGFGIEMAIQKIRNGAKNTLIVNAIQDSQIGLTLLKHA